MKCKGNTTPSISKSSRSEASCYTEGVSCYSVKSLKGPFRNYGWFCFVWKVSHGHSTEAVLQKSLRFSLWSTSVDIVTAVLKLQCGLEESRNHRIFDLSLQYHGSTSFEFSSKNENYTWPDLRISLLASVYTNPLEACLSLWNSKELL